MAWVLLSLGRNQTAPPHSTGHLGGDQQQVGKHKDTEDNSGEGYAPAGRTQNREKTGDSNNAWAGAIVQI